MGCSKRDLLVITVFVMLAALDFMPLPYPSRMILPLLWLTLCALYRRQGVLAVALGCSFLGDVMGWQHALLPQIGFFALAQITYILLFMWLRPSRASTSESFKIVALMGVALLYGAAMWWMIPKVTEPVIACGIAVYGLLLLGMWYSTWLQRKTWLILGGLLFVASDVILGTHLFVEKIPHSTLCIMIPYYLGQLMLFCGAQSLYKPEERRKK